MSAPLPTHGAVVEINMTDGYINTLFKATNFGPQGETPRGRRGLMVECVLKYASLYVDGSTITNICKKAGLIGDCGATHAGIRWAFKQMYRSGGTTIIERLHPPNVESWQPHPNHNKSMSQNQTPESPQPVAEAESLVGVANDVLLALRIRSLIADKEMVTATANLDLARGGEWRLDYSAWQGQLNVEIDALFSEAN